MSSAQILIVEDENIVGLNLHNRLTGLGYQVLGVVSSGEEALRTAEETKPDLVLMDIMLKGEMDGISAAEILKKRDIPVVYLTAYADDSTLDRAKVTEPVGYILKPYEIKDLRSTIEIALYRHRMEQKLKISEERYSLAVRGASDGIWDWDLVANRVYYSPRWKEMMGYSENEIQDSPGEWLSRLHPDDKESLEWDISRHLEGVTSCLENEYRILHQDGKYRWMYCRGLAVCDERGVPCRMAGSQSDVTRRRVLEEKLLHFAYYDPLTDLPNQVLFLDRLWDRFRRARSGESPAFITILVGLRNFSTINAEHGTIMANGVLLEVARRLQAVDFPGMIVSRFFGCEFGLIVEFPSHLPDILDVADQLIQEVSPPVSYGEKNVRIQPMLGMAVYNHSYDSADTILRDASFAMLSSGVRPFEVYSDSLRKK